MNYVVAFVSYYVYIYVIYIHPTPNPTIPFPAPTFTLNGFYIKTLGLTKLLLQQAERLTLSWKFRSSVKPKWI